MDTIWKSFKNDIDVDTYYEICTYLDNFVITMSLNTFEPNEPDFLRLMYEVKAVKIRLYNRLYIGTSLVKRCLDHIEVTTYPIKRCIV